MFIVVVVIIMIRIRVRVRGKQNKLSLVSVQNRVKQFLVYIYYIIIG